MKAGDIFQKTPSGLLEIGNRSNSLTVKQRRVLILVNGANDTATLKQEVLQMIHDEEIFGLQ